MIKERILGYPIDVTDFSAAPEDIFDRATTKSRKLWFACFNPHSCVVASSDDEFRAALLAANWLIPDGIGVVYASRYLGGKIRRRVTGYDVFIKISNLLNRDGGARVFFLGSTPETLERIRVRFAADFPGLVLAGTYSPPFRHVFSNEDNSAMVRAINAANADVLWVGLTAPKQEKWIHQNLSVLDVRFVGAIGAVFDFYAGTVTRSSASFQRLGLEWLPRLLRNPRRLWMRTFLSAPRFAWLVLKSKCSE